MLLCQAIEETDIVKHCPSFVCVCVCNIYGEEAWATLNPMESKKGNLQT